MNAAFAALLVCAWLQAQTPSPTQVSFAPPVRLSAGDKLLGVHRLYPSPVFHDVNGDGLADLVIGDLWGKITVALRLPGKDPRAFGPESALNGADGKPIDFQNW